MCRGYASLAVALYACAIAAGDSPDVPLGFWPTWRGTTGNGVSVEGCCPPVSWNETENIKWKTAIPGEGSSSPVVWGNKIFFLTAVECPDPSAKHSNQAPPENDSEQPIALFRFDVVCVSRTDGRILWQKTACKERPHEKHHPDHGYASYSPVTDGRFVWASFGSRGLHCYDLEGNHLWSVDLGKLRTNFSFGEGSSPALAGDAVVVVTDHEGDSLIRAFEKTTGKLLWERERDEGTTWATPLPVEVNGQLQVVTNATNRIRSYAADTGRLIWECGGQTPSLIPSPVSAFGIVFCTSGHRANSLQAIELGHAGDLTGSDAVLWEIHEATPYVPSPLLYEDKLYVCWSNRAIVSCYQAQTGQPFFVKQRLDEGLGGIYASPVGAGGYVYFTGRSGNTEVIRLSDRFEPVATNILNDHFDASAAIAGDEIILKGKEHLYCIAHIETGQG